MNKKELDLYHRFFEDAFEDEDEDEDGLLDAPSNIPHDQISSEESFIELTRARLYETILGFSKELQHFTTNSQINDSELSKDELETVEIQLKELAFDQLQERKQEAAKRHLAPECSTTEARFSKFCAESWGNVVSRILFALKVPRVENCKVGMLLCAPLFVIGIVIVLKQFALGPAKLGNEELLDPQPLHVLAQDYGGNRPLISAHAFGTSQVEVRIVSDFSSGRPALDVSEGYPSGVGTQYGEILSHCILSPAHFVNSAVSVYCASGKFEKELRSRIGHIQNEIGKPLPGTRLMIPAIKSWSILPSCEMMPFGHCVRSSDKNASSPGEWQIQNDDIVVEDIVRIGSTDHFVNNVAMSESNWSGNSTAALCLPVPEPATLILFSVAAAGMCFCRRRK